MCDLFRPYGEVCYYLLWHLSATPVRRRADSPTRWPIAFIAFWRGRAALVRASRGVGRSGLLDFVAEAVPAAPRQPLSIPAPRLTRATTMARASRASRRVSPAGAGAAAAAVARLALRLLIAAALLLEPHVKGPKPSSE